MFGNKKETFCGIPALIFTGMRYSRSMEIYINLIYNTKLRYVLFFYFDWHLAIRYITPRSKRSVVSSICYQLAFSMVKLTYILLPRAVRLKKQIAIVLFKKKKVGLSDNGNPLSRTRRKI